MLTFIFNQKCLQNNIFCKKHFPSFKIYTHTKKLCLDLIYILIIHVRYLLKFSHMMKIDVVVNYDQNTINIHSVQYIIQYKL
jgi:hypothetical protein